MPYDLKKYCNLFAYGTLMIPEIMSAVTGHNFPYFKATLKDYARFTIKAESYPGIIQMNGAKIDGLVYLELDDISIARLDLFEGHMYQRLKVMVETKEGIRLPAYAYLLKPEYKNFLSSEPWDINKFKERDLKDFLKEHQDFFLLRP